MTPCQKISAFLCTIIWIAILTFLILLFPILDMYISFDFKNKIICKTAMFVNITTWLMIKSITVALIFGVLFIILNSGKDSACRFIFRTIGSVLVLFNLVWLIIGSIMFWKDCPKLTPTLLNTYMWINLIIGFIIVCNVSKVLNDDYI